MAERGALPIAVCPRSEDEAGFDDLLALVGREHARLSEQLLTAGAILFRGFRVGTCEEFSALVEALSGPSAMLEYRGGASPRSALGSGAQPVYNSTEYPAAIELPLHNELSYSASHPAQIYFFCLVAPEEGGETTLGDSRRILRNMPADIRDRFERKGICYIRNLASGKGSGYSWQDAFGTEDRGEVERHCAALGAEHEWLSGGALCIRETLPALATHPVTGEQVWFNQADGFHPSGLDPASYAELMDLYGSEDRFRLNVTYGEGTPIEAAALETVRDVIRREAIPHAWQAGDVLMLDNMLAAHGRRPFSGARRIAVAMS
jgi:alpha-ketoglutarate-dependent taurine dioxygenase